MERQAEAVAAQGQHQLLTLLQKSELTILLLCSGPTSIRTKESDPDNSKGLGSVLQGMSHHTETKFSLPGQRKTAGRMKIIASSQWAKLSGIGPERGYRRGLSFLRKGLSPLVQGGCPRQGTWFPETTPYLLIRYAQARRGPHSRLVIAGILAVVFHLGLGQAAAQGTHPISPAEVGEAELGLSAYAQNSLPCPCAPRQARGRWHGKLSPYPCPVGNGFLATNLREI